MKKIVLTIMVVLIFCAGTAIANPFIPDNYLHPFDVSGNWQQIQDVIGNAPPYGIAGTQWSDDKTQLTISLDWYAPDLSTPVSAYPGGMEARLGDVFVGGKAIALRDHGFTFNNGAIAEDVIIKAGDIFLPSSYYTSDYYYGPTTGLYPHSYDSYGDHEIVAALGNKIGSVQSIVYTQGQSIIITFSDSSFYSEDIGFAQICANDVFRVPEPSSLLLLGFALLGLGVLGKKRRS